MVKNSLRHQLLRMQRKNYASKTRAAQKNFADPPYVVRYGREYLAELRDYQKVATRRELLRKATKAEIIYHGDYHPLRHSQRAVLAMLQALAGKRQIVVCLEMVHAADQKWLDRFQAREITESEFLRRIRYLEKWPYNFNPWRAILDFCRENQWMVLGINSPAQTGPHALRQRDKVAARMIARTFLRSDSHLIYVVDGDFHISPSHLPKEVEKLLAPLGVYPRRLLLYQNVERLYWKMAERGQEEAPILKMEEDAYCLMNTMPATKLQSYLDWLEYAEGGYFPLTGDGSDLGGDYYLSHIQDMARDLCVLLHLELPKDAMSKLVVFSGRNLDFAERVKQNPLLRAYWSRIRAKIAEDEAFLLEFGTEGHRRYWAYLPNASINQVAEEASHWVHAVLRGPMKTPPDSVDAFYQTVMTEALGFFGSKLFNEKRKAATSARLRRQLGRVKKGELSLSEMEISLSRRLLQHLHLELHATENQKFRAKFDQVWHGKDSSMQSFATQLGYILGNKIYEASKRNRIPITEVAELFLQSFAKPEEALNEYRKWVQKTSFRH